MNKIYEPNKINSQDLFNKTCLNHKHKSLFKQVTLCSLKQQKDKGTQ